MRIPLSALLTVLAVQSTLAAQVVITRAPASQQKSDQSLVFYKAFYLDRGVGNFGQAVGLYRKFLAASADSKLASTAAHRLVNLLYRTDKIDAAKAAEEKFAALLKQKQRQGMRGDPRGAAGRQGRDRRRDRAGRGQGGTAAAGDSKRAKRLQAMIQNLKGQLEEAKGAGDDGKVKQLSRQLARIEGSLERVKAGGGRGQAGRGQRGERGQRGRRRRKPLSEMTKEEGVQWAERMEGMLERFGDRMGEERAAALEKGLKKVKALIQAGKMKEAEEYRAKHMRFGRRRGG